MRGQVPIRRPLFKTNPQLHILTTRLCLWGQKQICFNYTAEADLFQLSFPAVFMATEVNLFFFLQDLRNFPAIFVVTNPGILFPNQMVFTHPEKQCC